MDRISTSFAAAIARLMDIPGYGWLVGTTAAALALLVADPFPGILGLAALASGVDYYYGRRYARLTGTFDSVRAELGWQSKMAGVILLILLRGFEWWAASWAGLALPPVVAVVPAVGLFVKELESIDDGRRACGAGPLPGIGQLFDVLRSWERSRITGPSTRRSS